MFLAQNINKHRRYLEPALQVRSKDLKDQNTRGIPNTGTAHIAKGSILNKVMTPQCTRLMLMMGRKRQRKCAAFFLFNICIKRSTNIKNGVSRGEYKRTT